MVGLRAGGGGLDGILDDQSARQRPRNRCHMELKEIDLTSVRTSPITGSGGSR